MTAARGLHHLAIRVRDLGAAERFYCGTLGLRVLRRWPAADGGPGERSIWVDAGDGAFLALEALPRGDGDGDGDRDGDGGRDGDGDGERGLFLVALRIEARERGAWQERLARAGVAVYHHTAFTIYVRDPEGNRVGLSHHPQQPDDGAADGG